MKPDRWIQSLQIRGNQATFTAKLTGEQLTVPVEIRCRPLPNDGIGWYRLAEDEDGNMCVTQDRQYKDAFYRYLDAMDKAPKSGKKFSNLPQLIRDLWGSASDGEEWSGYLWRAGGYGVYYHADREGAAYYGQGGATVEKFVCPELVRGLFLDVEDQRFSKYYDGDIGLAIEKYLPVAKKRGFDCVVIFGETGSEVWGVPIEVVLFNGAQRITESLAGIILGDLRR